MLFNHCSIELFRDETILGWLSCCDLRHVDSLEGSQILHGIWFQAEFLSTHRLLCHLDFLVICQDLIREFWHILDFLLSCRFSFCSCLNFSYLSSDILSLNTDSIFSLSALLVLLFIDSLFLRLRCWVLLLLHCYNIDKTILIMLILFVVILTIFFRIFIISLWTFISITPIIMTWVLIVYLFWVAGYIHVIVVPLVVSSTSSELLITRFLLVSYLNIRLCVGVIWLRGGGTAVCLLMFELLLRSLRGSIWWLLLFLLLWEKLGGAVLSSWTTFMGLGLTIIDVVGELGGGLVLVIYTSVDGRNRSRFWNRLLLVWHIVVIIFSDVVIMQSFLTVILSIIRCFATEKLPVFINQGLVCLVSDPDWALLNWLIKSIVALEVAATLMYGQVMATLVLYFVINRARCLAI